MSIAGQLRSMRAVARRELRVLLGSALGWSVAAAFALLAGTVFAVAVFRPGAPATLRGTMIALGWGVLLAAPALSMRAVVEERRAGTWASLVASPAGIASIIVGKFVASLALLIVALAVPLMAQSVALEWFAAPDWVEAGTGLVGLALAGAMYLASGVLMSALVGNQVAAYLLTVFLWLAWLALARSAPLVLPATWASAAFASDPLRRLDDFQFGLFDTGNVAYFVSVCTWFLLAAVVAASRDALPARLASGRRVGLGLALAAVAAIAAIGALDAPRLRRTVDMTASRAYTLTPATRATLESLAGRWQVAVTMTSPPTAVARQVDEVLAGIGAIAGRDGFVRTSRIDPSDPADAARYEAMLEAVQARDAEALALHDAAIRRGLQAFRELCDVAAVQAPLLEALVPALAADDPSRADLDALRAGFAQLAAQRRSFERSIAQLRSASDARPFPEESRAASAIAANLRHWASELAAAALRLGDRAGDPGAPAVLAPWVSDAPSEYAALSRELRKAQDEIDRLPKTWGADVGAALAAGDCAVIIGPPGIVTVPAWQLVSGSATGNGIALDRRFRGEQAIVSAIRGISGGALPVAVVMHSGPPGILRSSADRADLSAAADALRTSRIEVREWVPGEGPQPAAPGQPVVWIVLAPVDRDASTESRRERDLLSAAQRLAVQGEPILLTVGPSLLPLLGQADPWGTMLAGRGMVAETGRTILELVPVGPGKSQVQATQVVLDGDPGSVLGRAIDGQRVALERPVPLQLLGEPSGAFAPQAVLSIDPAPERWIESDWRRDVRARASAPEEKRLPSPVPVVACVERPAGPRAVLVGSPTWLTTAVADAADPLGGGRVALRHPGNRDLLVSAVMWLAGRDDLVAGSGAGREVARLPRLSAATVIGVAAIEAIGVPAGVAALGAMVVVRRRMRT